MVIFLVEDFYFDSVVTLGAMVIFSSKAELCFFAKCEKSDWSHFLLHHHSKIKEVCSGDLSGLKLCLQLPVGDNLL